MSFNYKRKEVDREITFKPPNYNCFACSDTGIVGDSDGYLRSRGMDPAEYRRLSDEAEKSKIRQAPIKKPAVKYLSPFSQRRSSVKVRENWSPDSEMQTPMMYAGVPYEEYKPFKQMESGQPTSIWEKIRTYGKDVDKKVKRFVKHNKYNPTTDKPIASIQNPKWKNVIMQWLQSRRKLMIEATRANEKQKQQQVSQSILNLIQDINTYSGKYLDWTDRNSGENKPGSKGSSVVSLGSKKDEKFIGDMTFMGDLNTNILIGDDGKMGIKSFGLEGVKYVEDLDVDVFARDDVGKMTFLEASGKLQKEAEAGKPLNESIVTGYADELLRNEDSILSWAFDPLYGSSWIQDWTQANPDADVSVFMPESKNYDLDLLTDELHGWLTSKLTQAYNKNIPKQKQQGPAAEQIMQQTTASIEQEKANKQGIYKEEDTQAMAKARMTPPKGQDSPMAYAMNIIKKYNK